MNIRFVAPSFGVAAVISVALAGSALAGGGGFPPTPGKYRTTDQVASASLSGPPTTVIVSGKGGGPGPSDFAYVTVDRGLHTFKPKAGPRLVQQSGTMLTVFAFSQSGGSVDGCWMIADTDFVFASDLSSASLRTTVPAASNCPGSPLDVSSVGTILPKGGGGGGGGLGAPVTLDLTWTSRGLVNDSTFDGENRCAGASITALQTYDSTVSDAQGQISGLSSPLTSDFATISKSTTDQNVKGTMPDGCFF